MLCSSQSLAWVIVAALSAHSSRVADNMTPPSADKIVLDTLKDVHNRGAQLYNAGDHVSAFRMYQGALIVARPILSHRVSLQKVVNDGLSEVDRSHADFKLKAFRLHEVIDQVREEIKSELKSGVSMMVPSMIERATAGGHVKLAGQPVSDVCVLFFPRGGIAPAAMAVSTTDGRFSLTPSLPPGRYVLALVSPQIPNAFQKADSSPLQIELKPGANVIDASVNH